MKKIFGVFGLVSIVSLVSCGFDDLDQGLSFEDQLAIDVELIDAYLLDNDINAEVHESGIRYIHNVIGEGASPSSGDIVVIKYNGTLFSGILFGEDSLGLTLRLSNPTIGVLQLMIPTMHVGGKLTVFAPSGYCFGNTAVGNVPANSNLIFELELLAIIDSPEDQLLADESIIDEFLFESDLVAEIHESGIRFITLTEGTGSSPIASDRVSVKYKGTFMNGQIFDQRTMAYTFLLQDLIEAWKIMIPTMKEGGKIKIYAPSKYCYGTSGSSTIPPNTILVFEIELVSIL